MKEFALTDISLTITSKRISDIQNLPSIPFAKWFTDLGVFFQKSFSE